jgi:hypothetical protein
VVVLVVVLGDQKRKNQRVSLTESSVLLQTGLSAALVPTEKVPRAEVDVVEADEEDEQQLAVTHRNQLRITLIAMYLVSNNHNAHRLAEARRAVDLANVEMIDAAATGMVVEVQMAELVLALKRRRKNLMRRWMITGVILLLLRVAPRKRLLLHLQLRLRVSQPGPHRQGMTMTLI